MIKIAVCDDEIPAIQNLSSLIYCYMKAKNIPCEISHFMTGEILLNRLLQQEEYFDILFLDIKMKEINGIETAKRIRQQCSENIYIIFVTALKEYVFDAFDVNAYHYLLKPIEKQKLYNILGKVSSRLMSTEDRFLVIQKCNQIKKIPFCNILYCEVINHRVFIYEQTNTHAYGSKIECLEQELDDDFFRCHRSYIVNLKYVNEYKDGIAYLPGGEKIPIATRRQSDFLKALLIFQRKEVR